MRVERIGSLVLVIGAFSMTVFSTIFFLLGNGKKYPYSANSIGSNIYWSGFDLISEDAGSSSGETILDVISKNQDLLLLQNRDGLLRNKPIYLGRNSKDLRKACIEAFKETQISNRATRRYKETTWGCTKPKSAKEVLKAQAGYQDQSNGEKNPTCSRHIKVGDTPTYMGEAFQRVLENLKNDCKQPF